ncbi:unnamed protein product [Paramecium primaurelia]|uniref:Uncharacterized protein n=1 Tax=Paramecium primaurelia TaxID=5886 RepID=A0A8S1MVJ7_PARPR|nr:unnamed protein product [Paramecium primaurelia]
MVVLINLNQNNAFLRVFQIQIVSDLIFNKMDKKFVLYLQQLILTQLQQLQIINNSFEIENTISKNNRFDIKMLDL